MRIPNGKRPGRRRSSWRRIERVAAQQSTRLTSAEMIRWIPLAIGLGALAATGSQRATIDPPREDFIASRIAATERTSEAKPLSEDWPICTTTATMGSETEWVQLDPDFAEGKWALVAEDWNGAIEALELAALRDPRNADIQNYIGYAHRRLRQWGPAMQHYQRAITLNRRHRSAHEHLGELYLALGEPAKAEQQLATLEDICLIPCVETEDLKRAIATYRTLAAR